MVKDKTLLELEEASDILIATAMALYRYTGSPTWGSYFVPRIIERFNKAAEAYRDAEQRYNQDGRK